MRDEKVLVALVRIQDRGDPEQTVPLGFKLQVEKIPGDIKWDRIHNNNIVNLKAFGGKTITVMLVVNGDDSPDTLSRYKHFCSRVKQHRLPNLASKITNWFSLAEIEVSKAVRSKFVPIKSKEFQNFIHHIETLVKLDIKVNPKEKNKSVMDSKCASTSLDKHKSGNKQLIDLAGDDSSSQSVSKESVISLQSKNLKTQESSCSELKDLFTATKERLSFFRSLSSNLPSNNPLRLFMQEISTIQFHLFSITKKLELNLSQTIQVVKVDDRETEQSDLKFINEEDKTSMDSHTTLIEGILPVKTSGYTRALSSLPTEKSERVPAQVITALVRECFPDHWVNGVTVKGQGGNISLLEIWSVKDPLSVVETKGKGNKQLGHDRYQALIEHSIRQCGKKTYDTGTEKHLGTILSKNMYYKRNKTVPKNGWDLLDETASGSEEYEDKAHDESPVESDDDPVAPQPKTRRLTRASNKSNIIMPEVSLSIGSPIRFGEPMENDQDPQSQENSEKKESEGGKSDIDVDEEIEKETNIKDKQNEGKLENPAFEDENSLSDGLDEDTVMRMINEESDDDEKVDGDGEGDNGKIKHLKTVNKEKRGNDTTKNKEDEFEFDTDDDFLRDLKIDDGAMNFVESPSECSLFSSSCKDERSNTSEPRKGATVRSSTPLTQKNPHLRFPVVSKKHIHETTSNESGIGSSVSASHINIGNTSDASLIPKKRKDSTASLPDLKRFKPVASNSLEETKREIQDKSEIQKSAAKNPVPSKTMDPNTLAFISDPNNISFLAQLIEAAKNNQKN